jgi:hypothetical protein
VATAPISILVSNLPADPSIVPTAKAIAACRHVYEIRDQIIGNVDAEDALEALRRTGAIEKYVKNKEHKAEASYAARILETAIGAALGDPEPGGPGRGKKNPARVPGFIEVPERDRQRFRLMYQYREAWLPLIDTKFKPAKKHAPRREILKQIDAIRRPKAEGEGVACIVHSDAIEWLNGVEPADLLLTDPPYSTDVEDVRAFVQSWFPLALSKLKPSGRALVFIGAYADELAAYFSCSLPEGWEWGTPHAWVYRNTIGPTPDYDFVRNWQCVLSARGPDADKLQSDRITELLAGFVENAPDGRQDVKYHRWEKPLSVMQRFIRVASNPGNVVLDPFAGSGTTLLAAKAEGRHGVGCDIDEDAVNAAIERGVDEA